MVQLLASAMYQGFVEHDGGAYLSRTGCLISQPSLRVLKTRKAFALIRKAVENVDQKRLWTKPCLRDAVALMMSEKKLEVPQTAGFSWQQWLKDQVDSLHDLAQKARRNQWRVTSMADNAPILPYNPEEPHTANIRKHQCNVQIRFAPW